MPDPLPEPPPPPARRTGRRPARFSRPLVLLLLAAVGVALWLLDREKEPPPPPDDATLARVLDTLRTEGRPALVAAIEETRDGLVEARRRSLGISDPLVSALAMESGSGVDWTPILDVVERIRAADSGPRDEPWCRRALGSDVALERLLGLRALRHLPLPEVRTRLLPAAVPSLGHEDDTVRDEATRTLAEFEADVHEELVRALSTGSPKSRTGAAFVLLKTGAEVPADRAEPLLADGDPAVRIHGAGFFARDSARSEEILPILAEGLRQDDLVLLRLALVFLASYGPEAAEQGPALAGLLDHEDRFVRHRAACALASIGAPAVPRLVTASRSGDPRVRLWAAFALGRSGTAEPAAVEALIRLLSDPDETVRKEAAEAPMERRIEAIVGNDPGLSEETNGVRGSAILAVGRIGGPAAAADGPLLRLLHGGTEIERILAAGSLARIAPGASEETVREIVGALERAERADNPAIRRAAENALEALDVR